MRAYDIFDDIRWRGEGRILRLRGEPIPLPPSGDPPPRRHPRQRRAYARATARASAMRYGWNDADTDLMIEAMHTTPFGEPLRW